MSTAEIVRLTPNDMEEGLWVMDVSFAKNGTNATFRDVLPKMCYPEEDIAGMHLAIRRDGALRAILGVYPLHTVMGGKKVLFSTTGNVGTLPEERGKGYMTLLLNEAMRENQRRGIVATRLSSGHPVRYERFGFWHCGINYHYTVTPECIAAEEKNALAGYSFRIIEKGESAVYTELQKIHTAQPFYVERPTDRAFYDTMVAWQNVPYVIYNADGAIVGFMAAKGSEIAELYAYTPESFITLLLAWVQHTGKAWGIPLLAHQTAEMAMLNARGLEVRQQNASMFRVMDWQQILSGTLAINPIAQDFRFTAQITPTETPECSLCDSGTFTVTKDGAVRSDDKPDIVLPYPEAGKYFFGRAGEPVETAFPFPLPLSWNLQDRL